MHRPVRNALVCSALLCLSGFACGPVKEGGETGTGGSSTEAASGTGSGSSSGSSSGGEVVTSGEPCSELGCGECDDGCVPDPVCVDGEVVCDCSTCAVNTSTTGTTGPATTGESSSGESSTGEVLVVECGGDTRVFPEFDRACTEPADCAVALHQVDCCGSLVAWGINSAELARFDKAEKLCGEMFPICDCAPMPTLVEDGSSTELNETIAVTCEAGSCASVQG